MRVLRVLTHTTLLVVIASTTMAGETTTPLPWFVRIIVDAWEPICERAAVDLQLKPSETKPLRIPIKSTEFIDVNWDVSSLDPGVYELHVTETSCTGLLGRSAKLEFDYNKRIRRKVIYVGVGFAKANLSLQYLEIGTEWNAENLLSVSEKDGSTILQNKSDFEIRRCEYWNMGIFEEFLAAGEWGAFERGDHYEWPKGSSLLKPGESVPLKEESGVKVYRGRGHPHKLVRPTAQRFIVPAQPTRRHFQILAESSWQGRGLPGCDYYYVEYATPENAAPLKIWE